MNNNIITAADLFCGAGGSSTGLIQAAQELGVALDLLAVNHWQMAVKTHQRNHPWARHLCADLGETDPNKAVPGGHLNILIASPECTHHSNARGAKPCSDQSRASAWHVLHWADRLRADEVMVENVREFINWGPLLDNNRPDPDHKGETFNAFVFALKSMGYTKVEYRILNAADYGDATKRHRVFLRASRSGNIVWPEKTHEGRWRPVRDVINWDVRGNSIRNRKRPLAKRTLERIEQGLKKFGGEPFIAILRGTDAGHMNSTAKSVDEPLGTITAGGTHMALCEPFIIPMEHSGRQSLVPVSEPLPTITTTKGGSFGLCTPFITKYYGTGGATPVDAPLDTITTKDRFGLVEPRTGDILFRMLQPAELAAAMGFDNYVFEGNKAEQVKQIGNAVSVRTARALCSTILERYKAVGGTVSVTPDS